MIIAENGNTNIIEEQRKLEKLVFCPEVRITVKYESQIFYFIIWKLRAMTLQCFWYVFSQSVFMPQLRPINKNQANVTATILSQT